MLDEHSFQTDVMYSIEETRQGSALYLYRHDRSNKCGGLPRFDHTRARTPPGTESKSDLIVTLHFGTQKNSSSADPVFHISQTRQGSALHLYSHDRSKKYGGLPRFDHTRAPTPPGTESKSGLIGTLCFGTKKNSFPADRVFHLGQTGQDCASYAYSHDRSKKYGACQSFDHTRAHTPPGTWQKSGLIGTCFLALKKFFPSRSGVPHQADRVGFCMVLVSTRQIEKIWWFAQV